MARRNLTRPGWLVALGLLAAVLAAAGGESKAQARAEGLIRDGTPPDLFLLYTGDVIGHLGPCG